MPRRRGPMLTTALRCREYVFDASAFGESFLFDGGIPYTIHIVAFERYYLTQVWSYMFVGNHTMGTALQDLDLSGQIHSRYI